MKNQFVFMLLFLAATVAYGEDHHNGAKHINEFAPSIIIILLVLILAILGTLLYKRVSSKTSKIKPEELNEMSSKILSERFAKGEISKKEHEAIYHEVELLEDTNIETNKLRLAKGEISYKEYNEIKY